MVKATCSVCKKEFEMDDKYSTFVEKYPEKVKCPDCYKEAVKGTKPATTKTTATSAASKAKGAIDAKLLRKSYDELVAEFADIKDEVKEYLGGWTTTIALSKTK